MLEFIADSNSAFYQNIWLSLNAWQHCKTPLCSHLIAISAIFGDGYFVINELLFLYFWIQFSIAAILVF